VKVTLLTLGCKANQAESFLIESDLRRKGYNIVGINEKPDLCIINTCSVTAKSDYHSRQLIRRAGKAGSSVIVTGCYSELNKAEVKAMDGVELVVDNAYKTHISKLLSSVPSDITLRSSLPGRGRFFLKVQDGCNNSCSYCLIPMARGSSKSEPVDEVVSRIDAISADYAEVVLTGIHLGTYGYDLLPKVNLAGLLTMILKKTRIQRIRLSSLEIREIDDRLLELLQDGRICRHLHIPLQSGDDKILFEMNRSYNTLEYQRSVERVLLKVPEVSIGTDIITGFPGEGEKEFRNTYDFLQSIQFSYFHVFPYSSRRGTRASQLPGIVDSIAKKERASMLRALGKRKKTEYMLSQLGKALDLLVEEMDDEGTCHGTTGNYLRVKALIRGALLKEIVPVRIAAIQDGCLVGHRIASS
jgi:threonylcarbamoyladenosine tRNA methylthiotransferase MtaB